jgi:nucleoid-associated protein YgaU
MTRTGVRRRRLAATMTLALLAAVWAGPLGRIVGEDDQVDLAARSSYVVHQGDTLWSIAQRVAPEQDPRALVDAITAANGVDAATIVPGQTLLVPTGS